MNNLKSKLLEELMEHLAGSQGSDLKKSLDDSKNPIVEQDAESPDFNDQAQEAIASSDGDKQTLGEAIGYPGSKKPKSLLESGDDQVASLGSEDEMSDEELEELMKKLV